MHTGGRVKEGFKKEKLWAIRSLKKSDHEQIALVALYKKTTVNKSLSIYLKKSDFSDSLMIQANRSQKTRNSLENIFWYRFFWEFFTFLWKRANHSCCSSLSCSLLKINGIDSLTVALF